MSLFAIPFRFLAFLFAVIVLGAATLVILCDTAAEYFQEAK